MTRLTLAIEHAIAVRIAAAAIKRNTPWMTDPYEACEAAGLAEEAGWVACDTCGGYGPLEDTWHCWSCNAYGCHETCGVPCDHFGDRLD